MPIFVDTNVLIYAFDPRDAAKQTAAQAWLRRCWKEKSGRISTQVLNEFYVNLVRLQGGTMRSQARAEIKNLLAWSPCAIDQDLIETAWHVADSASVSHWDALVVAAAMRQRCEILLSEDMQHGREIEGVRIVNPFVMDAAIAK